MKYGIFGVLVGFFCSVADGAKWYEEMEIGPAWANTFARDLDGKENIAALKGILVDLGDRKAHALYDTETLRWVTAYQGFVKWAGTPWTGSHGAVVKLENQEAVFSASSAVGWADESGSFNDKRPLAGHGNLPVEHGRFLGHRIHGRHVMIASEVHGASVLQCMTTDNGSMQQHLTVGPRKVALRMLVANDPGAWRVCENGIAAQIVDGLQVIAQANNPAVKLSSEADRLMLELPAGEDGIAVQLGYRRGQTAALAPPMDLVAMTLGGPQRYPQSLETRGSIGKADGISSWAVDKFSIPVKNPWNANMRLCAFDFVTDDSLAVTTWNGDVWTLSGFSSDIQKLTWRRIASGLFEPLGLKVVGGVIHVLGRDGITQLIDQNGDGETDFYKAFNRDILITRNFHEFAFELQTDAEGNFYFCKGSPVRGGGRGFENITSHHGIVAKVSKDGAKFEVIATGLRAPGGMSVGPAGQITTGENEGSWQPCCKLNYILPAQLPAFLGTEPCRHALGEGKPLTEPLCYFPMDVDNSGGSQVWTTEKAPFGLNPNELIHLSYGQSCLYRVLPERKGDVLQGAVVKLPINLSSSAMRARFHTDGSLFVAGFRGWQTNAANASGIQRIRFTPEKPLLVPSSWITSEDGVIIGFDVEIDEELANDPQSFSAERWNYVRSPQYGSGHYSVDQPDVAAEKQATLKEMQAHRQHDPVEILSSQLQPDGKSIAIKLKGMKPAMTLKLSYDLETADGTVLIDTIHATVKKIKE